ncbi:hypothetical protein JVT61DRAFT_3755 [Boletus reticuloceps]|uniref:Uncharacterized protein n=1 Tax=Boletus reticuloceps TaxID=495285 RepID=A0A8I2YMU4_9AGAM|nr:hypothetical protein JVT61DRAFT_3755 [Boletus reticuloceps]
MMQKHKNAGNDQPSQSTSTSETHTSETPSTHHNAESSSSDSASPYSSNTVKAHLTAPSLTAKYAATNGIIPCIEFRAGRLGNVLVVKEHADKEFILRGVFQISWNDFFLTPDGSFNPNNQLDSWFRDTKLNCRLTSPTNSNYVFAQDDFAACIENISKPTFFLSYENQ